MSTNSKVGKIYLTDAAIALIPDSKLLVEAAVRRGQSMTELIKPSSHSGVKIDLTAWKRAWSAAENVDDPNRNPLYQVYDNIMIDNTLTSIIDTRILKTLQAKFNIVDKAGKPDEEAKKLFEKVWFRNFIKYSMQSQFEGPKLIELFEFDDNGEVKKCTLVNKYHVKPEKGIVTKESEDDNGISYLDGSQALYYIQVGESDDLGLLFKVAPHILAKKYALGQWAEFNEKLGIPMRTVHSNSTDTTRQKQLAVIMENLGSAGWAVLSENEKLEVHSISGTDPTKCFDGLINMLNNEPAMLILGQSSTSNSSNNKGTYGSMQILQEISNDRHENDLVFLKYTINDSLMPRLVQYSPAYGILKDKYFEWDKSVDLSVSETVDYVIKLSEKYKIPADFVTKKTGIPIDGIIENTIPKATASVKKKDLTLNSKIINLYGSSCCNSNVINAAHAATTPSFQSDMIRIAKSIFKGAQSKIIDVKLISGIAKYLREGITSSYGEAVDDKDIEMLKSLERNVFVFSGFKTYQILRKVTDKLTNDKGEVLSWADFKKEVLHVDKTYNTTFLRAEYDHAVVGSQMASQWVDIQNNKDTLPLLEFDATLDGRTTATCRGLDGMILPVDDAAWENYYLPLHWGERSVIRQLASGKISDKSKITFPDIKPMFQNNIGISGVAFPPNHPYYEASKSDTKKIMKEVNKIIPDDLKN